MMALIFLNYKNLSIRLPNCGLIIPFQPLLIFGSLGAKPHFLVIDSPLVFPAVIIQQQQKNLRFASRHTSTKAVTVPTQSI